jgi:FkbM family methyltransferase
MKESEQIRSVIKMIKSVTGAMHQRRISMEDIQNIQMAAGELNRMLYHSERLKFQKTYDLRVDSEYDRYVCEIEQLTALWEQSLERRAGIMADRGFWELYEYFKYVGADTIYQSVVDRFRNLPEGMRIEFLSLRHRYLFLQNGIDYTQNDFSLIRQHVDLMEREVENYRWLYGRLSDYRSKLVLNGIIRYWFRFDIQELHRLSEGAFLDYFDLDILQCDENEVIADLGAYTGDSVLGYIRAYGTYKRIYAYEPDPSNYQKLVQNVGKLPDVVMRQRGVCDKPGILYMDGTAGSAGGKILDQGSREIAVTSLDEDIQEPLSIIKMDIEGAEKDAIRGASSHIRSEKPRLLISTYHIPEDIFEIPRLISDMREDYRFYMRLNGRGIWPCDYVLFAI